MPGTEDQIKSSYQIVIWKSIWLKETRRYKNICNQLLSKLLKRLKRRQTQYPLVRKQD